MRKLLSASLLALAAFAALAASPRSAVLDVKNMTCELCPVTVKKSLERVPGVSQARIDFATKTATVTASATGSVLGTPGGVAATTRSSVYGTSSGTFTGNVPPMGSISGSIDAAGNIVAEGTNVPNPGISRWNVTGTITPTQIRLNFTVTFTAGAPAAGNITLNKP